MCIVLHISILDFEIKVFAVNTLGGSTSGTLLAAYLTEVLSFRFSFWGFWGLKTEKLAHSTFTKEQRMTARTTRIVLLAALFALATSLAGFAQAPCGLPNEIYCQAWDGTGNLYASRTTT